MLFIYCIVVIMSDRFQDVQNVSGPTNHVFRTRSSKDRADCQTKDCQTTPKTITNDTGFQQLLELLSETEADLNLNERMKFTPF